MLTRPSVVARRAGITALAVSVVLLAVPVAVASPVPVDCPPEQVTCTVEVDSPADQGSARPAASRAGKGGAVCRVPQEQPNGGAVVPCQVPEFGWWSNADGCYFRLLQPQPPRSEPEWEGHTDGAIYEMTCAGVRGTGGGWVWRRTLPARIGPSIDPAVLAQRAVRELVLRGPVIRMAPPVGSLGLVHVPVWLWTAVTPTTWGPASATASVPGVSVTAVARAVTVRWDMGDGHVITCQGPGTPYRPGLQLTASPTCGHVYERSSAGRPDDAYPVTAVTTWRVTWSGGGRTGALTVTRTSHVRVRIGEMQALT